MKKAFKLFGFIALSMTLAVACGNANNTPAEEETVVEEQATEVVEEAVQTPATEEATATCEEKKEEKQMTVQKVDMDEVEKEKRVEQDQVKLNKEAPTTVQKVTPEEKASQTEQGKARKVVK